MKFVHANSFRCSTNLIKVSSMSEKHIFQSIKHHSNFFYMVIVITASELLENCEMERKKQHTHTHEKNMMFSNTFANGSKRMRMVREKRE